MSENKKVILGSAYFGPVQYFSCFLKFEHVIIEKYDNYTKQTYRNRCRISGPNDVQNLVIPVKREKGDKTLLKDIRIDYDTDWQKIHFRSIHAAYRSSPFFDFYFDDYREFFEKKTKFLLDLNLGITHLILSQLGITSGFSLTEKFMTPGDDYMDFREIIHPKKASYQSTGFSSVEYVQVFSDRHAFIENLSIIDLLFNTGPEAILYLRKCQE